MLYGRLYLYYVDCLLYADDLVIQLFAQIYVVSLHFVKIGLSQLTCHAKSGPGQEWSAQTRFGSQKWSGGGGGGIVHKIQS